MGPGIKYWRQPHEDDDPTKTSPKLTVLHAHECGKSAKLDIGNKKKEGRIGEHGKKCERLDDAVEIKISEKI
jgi:hypothetical protein